MNDFMTWLFQSQRVHDFVFGMWVGWAVLLICEALCWLPHRNKRGKP